MQFKLTKTLLYQILFTICVGVPYLNIYTLTFGIWTMTAIFTIQQKYSIPFIKLLIPYFAILIIAFISMFYYETDLKNVLKDITYLIKPILGIVVGYQLCKRINTKAIITIVYAGVFIAVVHLIIILYSAVYYRIGNIHILRHYGGFFSDYEVYSLIILMFHEKFQLPFTKKRQILLLSLVSISFLLYVSRTNFIQFVVFYLGIKGYLSINKKSIAVLTSVVLLTISGYAIIYNMNFSRNESGLGGLLYKIKNAPIEAFKTKVDKNNYKDFNDNYRSFETITTLKQVNKDGSRAIFFGKGLGSSIKLGREVWTNDGTLITKEPFVHNAYMTVYLKSGILGVLFLIYFMWLLINNKTNDQDQIIRLLNLLLITTGVFLIIENWILLGIFLKTESKAVLIGFILYYREFLIKNKNTSEND